MNKDKIFQNLLDAVKDDFFNQNLTELNIRHQIEEDASKLYLSLEIPYPGSWLQDALLPKLEAAFKSAYPEKKLQISCHPFIKAHRSQLTGLALRGIKNTIAIASGKGGVGKSTVAVNLAIALSRLGAKVGILDADIYGPSVPKLLGHHQNLQTSSEHYVPIAAHGISAMSIGYLTENDHPLIWRGPILAKSLLQMINLTLWDDLDYLFIDLPPGTGDIQLSLVQKIPLTGAVIVTTPQDLATMDAQKGLELFEKMGVHVIGIVENMSSHTCQHCGQKESIFGSHGAKKLCEKYHLPLLGELPLNQEIGQGNDAGQPITLHSKHLASQAFIKTAIKTAIELSRRPLNYAGKFPPIVTQ